VRFSIFGNNSGLIAMRHFLKFMPADKRAKAEHEYVVAPAQPTAERPARPAFTRKTQTQPQATQPNLEATGPEFGGLVERRQAAHSGCVPEYVDGFEDRRRGRGRPATRPARKVEFEASAKNIKAKLEASAATENTSAYLAALDNSALTLCDSGLFKKEPAESGPEPSFNPYDRG
jgi:hypothetical protein